MPYRELSTCDRTHGSEFLTFLRGLGEGTRWRRLVRDG